MWALTPPEKGRIPLAALVFKLGSMEPRSSTRTPQKLDGGGFQALPHLSVLHIGFPRKVLVHKKAPQLRQLKAHRYRLARSHPVCTCPSMPCDTRAQAGPCSYLSSGLGPLPLSSLLPSSPLLQLPRHLQDSAKC